MDVRCDYTASGLAVAGLGIKLDRVKSRIQERVIALTVAFLLLLEKLQIRVFLKFLYKKRQSVFKKLIITASVIHLDALG